MGLAASQARLLSITSRMSDTELRSQLINNAKMRLTTDSAKVSDEYIAALNQTQMMFTNFDTFGNERYQNLTFNALTAYSSYNTQYGVVNNNGQLLVSSLDAANFVASGQNVNEFLRLYGLEQTTTYWDALAGNTEYINYGIGYYDDFGEWQQFDTNIEELRAMYEGTPDAMGIAHYGLEASFNAVEYETYEILQGNYVAARKAYTERLRAVSRSYLSESATDLNTYIIHGLWVDLGGSILGDASLFKMEQKYDFDMAYDNVFNFISDADTYVSSLDDWNATGGTAPAVRDHTFCGITDDGINTSLNAILGGASAISTLATGIGWTGGIAAMLMSAFGVGGSDLINTAHLNFNNGQLLSSPNDSCLGIYRLLNAYVDGIHDTGIRLGLIPGGDVHYFDSSDWTHPFTHWQGNASVLAHDSSGVLTDDAQKFIDDLNSILDSIKQYETTARGSDQYATPGPGDQDEQEALSIALEKLGDLYSLIKNDLPNVLDEEMLRNNDTELQNLYNEYQAASENLARFIWGGSSALDTTSPGHQNYLNMFGANAQYKYYEHLDDPAWILSTYNMYTDPSEIVAGSPHENPYYAPYNTTTTYEGSVIPEQWYAFEHLDYATGTLVNTAQSMPTSYQVVKDILLLQCMLEHYGEPKYTWIDVNNPEENAEAKVRWYTNLFNRMLQGYEEIGSGLGNSADWLQFAFESGMVHMEQVNTYNQWVSLMYSNCTGITESTADVDVTLAEAKYKREMAKIEAKDKRYDMELKSLDTEHESLKQEYEQIKKVIQKNIERNMKMFQG